MQHTQRTQRKWKLIRNAGSATTIGPVDAGLSPNRREGKYLSGNRNQATRRRPSSRDAMPSPGSIEFATLTGLILERLIRTADSDLGRSAAPDAKGQVEAIFRFYGPKKPLFDFSRTSRRPVERVQRPAGHVTHADPTHRDGFQKKMQRWPHKHKPRSQSLRMERGLDGVP